MSEPPLRSFASAPRRRRQALPGLGGLYPERREPPEGALDRAAGRLRGALPRGRRLPARTARDFLARVERHAAPLGGAAEAALGERTRELRRALRRRGFERELVAEAFALIREQATRSLGVRPFDTQLLGGWVLLQGKLAEMDTGEGKTLSAVLPACTAALAGMPVHVISVNDYLTSRDAAALRPIYQAMGLSVGAVVEGLPPDARRAAYACDVTYCTNKEVAFDYLRDRITLENETGEAKLRFESLGSRGGRRARLLLRGLCYAIVDEADSVLVDEARTPLIITTGAGSADEEHAIAQALELARALEPGRHFTLQRDERRVEFSEAGRERLEALAEPLGGLWSGRVRREERVGQALQALHLFQRDEHYLVRDDRVQVIDEFTGRVMADRSWGRGLHQLIEAKEGCPLTGLREPTARISYQRFFRRYLRLAGMTGTAREVAGELRGVYRLPVVTIPPRRPRQRSELHARVLSGRAAKWQAVLERVRDVRAQRRPVLVGTRSVAASQELSELLRDAGIPHQVLSARQDEEEAAIVACAGEPGRVTVATNMAGRGTDIPLGPGVAERGGLHVILTEYHEARRIDRQLAGRCARQGDPGSFESIVCLEDALLLDHGDAAARWLAERSRAADAVPQWLARLCLRGAGRRSERLHSRMRRDLLRAEDQLSELLAFSGRLE